MTYQCENLSSHSIPLQPNFQRASFRYEVVLGEVNIDTNPDCDGDVCADPVQRLFPEAIHYQKSSDIDGVQYKVDIGLIQLHGEAIFNGKFDKKRENIKTAYRSP